MKAVACTAILLIAAFACFVQASKCPSSSYPKCQQGFLDLNKYIGVWYTQYQSASFFFGQDCYCETANYTLRADGTINVDNKCRKGSISAPLTGNVGDAVPNNASGPCDLTVKFPPSPVGGPYDVVSTDYSTFSIVASCLGSIGRTLDLDDVWILTRSPVANATLLNNIIADLKSYGFVLDDLLPITQTGCPAVY